MEDIWKIRQTGKISRLGEHDLSQICKSINAGHAGGIIRCVVEYLLEISV